MELSTSVLFLSGRVGEQIDILSISIELIGPIASYFLIITLTDDLLLQLDVEQCINELNLSGYFTCSLITCSNGHFLVQQMGWGDGHDY